jgi:hypothetical protein
MNTEKDVEVEESNPDEEQTSIVSKIRGVASESVARQIALKHENGKVVAQVPLLVGVLGVLVAPAWVGIGTIAVLVAGKTLKMERAKKR